MGKSYKKEVRLSSLQTDALKEIGNIGTGNAATALSQLISCPVNMAPPRVKLIEEKVFSMIMEDPGQIGVRIRILGEIRGDIYLLFSREDAEKLLEVVSEFGRLGKKEVTLNSALLEIANIMAGAYTTALFQMSHLSIFSSVPEIMEPKDLFSPDLLETASLLIENDLNISKFGLHSMMLLHPEPSSLKLFLKKIGVNDMESMTGK
ncbi:MAG: chemotaxis protein CheC [Candidatus Eremiobacteraeota bacterium]|nr:chemotaxis protein CheC [Candidatus Eremiobacteraeota bacterium]